MMRKTAICAILILVLVPAFALAAGQQGQGSDTTQGKGMQVPQQISSQNQACSQVQVTNQVQVTSQVQNTGQNPAVRNRTRTQEYEMVLAQDPGQSLGAIPTGSGMLSVSASQDQVWNMTGDMTLERIRDRMQLQDGSCGNCLNELPGLLVTASPQSDQVWNMTGDMTLERIRDRMQLQDGSCGNCLNELPGLLVTASPQPDQVRNMTGDMTLERIQDRMQLQDGSCGNCLDEPPVAPGII